MPAIDCDMNPTAIGNNPKKAGRIGFVYLLIAFFFFLSTFRKLTNFNNDDGTKQRQVQK